MPTLPTRRSFLTLALSAAGTALDARGTEPGSCPAAAHMAWVTDALKRMHLIKVGMTRKDLLAVFTTEGGLSTGLQQTFVFRDCPYFKVDVHFLPVGRPASDHQGRVTPLRDPKDIITDLSRPYLQFGVFD